jgi:hypothetical protein
MKRVENYKGFTIDTDDLGRQYIHNNASPYSEDSDRQIIGTGFKLEEIKKIIDEKNELEGSKMLKFTGTNTNGTVKYEAQSTTWIGLYNDLVNKGIISTVDSDPYEVAKLEKAGKSYSEFENEDGDIDFEAIEKLEDLTDAEIRSLISKQDGNAYYQTVEEL